MIWKQRIPHKVRYFLWRLAHTCLPIGTNLIQKGVPCPDVCVTCDIMGETHIHTFFICPKASSCWELVQLDKIITDLIHNINDFSMLLFDFYNRLSVQQQSLASMILWGIWKGHNSKLWEGSDTLPSIIVQRAKDSLNEWRCMQRARQPGQGTYLEAKWLKRLPPAVKCNVDCALFITIIPLLFTGDGLCIRDSSGQLVLGMSDYASLSSSQPEAKARIGAVRSNKACYCTWFSICYI